ncbi:NaeI family type II restriction endonuclease [Mycobacterium sp. ITM-2016-00317]|uniref:NaeI family type II restriction endonuclease n=1 Tax=Mycobacterium sp. ITM-2016-00317 TaxID=2099694 RepID=UPI00287F8665|nr:NaeI family type II restriction endonuclease [Mycobacterium sp. ITM-2016-00317]WNG88492.1 NaeI family type II restriction endonuclease [Mycobacterium sp. ITM-2016-00317]
MKSSQPDVARDEVAADLLQLDPDGERTGSALRRTFDQLYDGGRTGRFKLSQLYKTEKTHFGTLIEINLQREFKFHDGAKLDYCINGHEVDAKYSQTMWAWMLPPEAVGELCLLLSASDENSCFSMGLVRALPDLLNIGNNRDSKKTLSAVGRGCVVWLHRNHPMPPNILLQLPEAEVAGIFALRSGQQRVNELFRRAAGRLVSRAAVETVAQQLDPMKRVRTNGGARQLLAPEGIAIFGGDFTWQREAAEALGLPVPSDGQFVSAYLRPSGTGPQIQGTRWTLADKDTASFIPLSMYRAGRSTHLSEL